jgi:histidyl-tRNA synthetase
MKVPKRLRGMEDQTSTGAQAFSRATRSLGDLLISYGYNYIDTPIMEETELFLRKSGGELAKRMYTFTDPGGRRVSLRPEFTSSIVRACLDGLGSDVYPMRWWYAGPVFRYEMDNANKRQFTQMGAELLGVDNASSDAEVMAMAVEGLSKLGVAQVALVVGHIGFILAVLKAQNVSERGRIFLINSIPELQLGASGLEEVKKRAEVLGLSGSDERTDSSAQSDYEPDIETMKNYITRTTAAERGVRGMEEIWDRFTRKQESESPFEKFNAATELLQRVVQIKGKKSNALQAVKELGLPKDPLKVLSRFEESFEAFEQYGLDVDVVIDFGLVRGVAYYSDLIFDLMWPNAEGESLGGGGRYNGLAQAIGGSESIPAIGFAWSLDDAVLVSSDQTITGETINSKANNLLIRPLNEAASGCALQEVRKQRDVGKIVSFDMTGISLEKALAYAVSQGIDQVLTVDENGLVIEENVR